MRGQHTLLGPDGPLRACIIRAISGIGSYPTRGISARLSQERNLDPTSSSLRDAELTESLVIYRPDESVRTVHYDFFFASRGVDNVHWGMLYREPILRMSPRLASPANVAHLLSMY